MKKKQNDWLYLSGKITAKSDKEQKENLAKFFVKASELHGVWKNIFNPAEMESSEKMSWESYLARDLAFIAEHRPDLYMMKNWVDSKGARLEREFAKVIGLNLFYEEPYEGIEK